MTTRPEGTNPSNHDLKFPRTQQEAGWNHGTEWREKEEEEVSWPITVLVIIIAIAVGYGASLLR